MKSKAIFFTTCILSLNVAAASYQLQRYEQANNVERIIQKTTAGAVRGAYETLVYNGLVTGPTYLYAGQQSAAIAACTGALLIAPRVLHTWKLQSLHNDLTHLPGTECPQGFSDRVQAEEFASLPARMHEIGHIGGQLCTTAAMALAVWKGSPHLSETDRTRIIFGGIALGAFAWLTRDLGHNMRV